MNRTVAGSDFLRPFLLGWGLLLFTFGGVAQAGYAVKWTAHDRSTPPGTSYFVDSPSAACQMEHDAYAPNSGPPSAVPRSWKTYDCRWVVKPWDAPGTWTSARCVDETGNVASSVIVKLVPPGVCVPVAEPQLSRPTCSYNKGASSNPIIGDPVVLSNGSLFESDVDYRDGDGRIWVGRTYRSLYGTTNGSFPVYAPPSGLGDLWRLSFQWELSLSDYFSQTGSFGVISPDRRSPALSSGRV